MRKNKATTECDKRIVTCNDGTAQCDNRTIKYEKKKIRVLPNVTKVRLEVMLVLHNVRIEPLNVRKKIKEPLNITRELSHVMLKLHNVRMKLSNVRKK